MIGPNALLQTIRGVGPKKAALFAKKELVTLRDAAEFYPFRYEDRRHLLRPSKIIQAPENALLTIRGHLRDVREIPLRGQKKKMVEAWLEDSADGADYGEDHGKNCRGDSANREASTDRADHRRRRVQLLWFNSYAGLLPRLQSLNSVVATGAVRFFRNQAQITHPELEPIREDGENLPQSLHWGRIVPIYSATQGLSQRSIREVIAQCLEVVVPVLEDELPDYIRQRYKLMPIQSAVREIHFPQGMESGLPEFNPKALHRLIFEEFFKFQLLLQMERQDNAQQQSAKLRVKNRYCQQARTELPFTLTNAQERVIIEILEDLQEEKPMHRLVQGDVGSGKTMVASLIALEAIDHGWQCALMAPTETLAEQHFINIEKLFCPLGIECALLTSSLRKKQKNSILRGIAAGSISLVVGTHAIIRDSIEWKQLRLAIIDEQHRFGVRQRMALRNRQQDEYTPHLLTMTATPIPRSLALTAFGDLDVSTIDELPANRKPIATKVLPGEERQKLYNLIHREVKLGRQAYLVFPLIKQSEAKGMEHLRGLEEEFEYLQKGPLKGLKLIALHGKTSTPERQEIMQNFKDGKYDVLLSTTVIEVGIDVPNATVMAVEHADRFGLSQLHQLRGRVGRGGHESFCVLVTDIQRPCDDQGILLFSEAMEDPSTTWKRLQAMEQSQDGFVLAEEDLKLRGPGDFLGTKQSGSPSFRLADLQRDREILESAQDAACSLLEEDPKLNLEKHQTIRQFFGRIRENLGETIHPG